MTKNPRLILPVALAGEGLGFDSAGGAVVLGPGGAAYAGSFGGVSRFADR